MLSMQKTFVFIKKCSIRLFDLKCLDLFSVNLEDLQNPNFSEIEYTLLWWLTTSLTYSSGTRTKRGSELIIRMITEKGGLIYNGAFFSWVCVTRRHLSLTKLETWNNSNNNNNSTPTKTAHQQQQHCLRSRLT